MKHPPRPGFCNRCASTPDSLWIRLCPVHVAAGDMLEVLKAVLEDYPRLAVGWERKIALVVALAEEKI